MRKKEFNKVYQFKITLRDTHPPVWRRIQVPEVYTFWDLHVAIQDAMGWDDYHLHEFNIKNPIDDSGGVIGIPDDEDISSVEILAGWKQKIADWFSLEDKTADYMYDFGDGWEHTVTLEKIVPKDEKIKYPICLDGQHACPPEDCGGIPGYEEICQGKHEFQENYEDYDPKHFDPKEVSFDDPGERLEISRDFII